MANLFFSDDLGEVAGIDWQMCSVGVGAHDLASLLASTAHLAVPSLSEMIDCYTEVSGSERNTVEHDLRQVVVLVLMAIVASGPALIDGLGPEQREAQVIAVARAFEPRCGSGLRPGIRRCLVIVGAEAAEVLAGRRTRRA